MYSYVQTIWMYKNSCRIIAWRELLPESTIVSEGFKGGTRGAPIMPRDAVSRTAHVALKPLRDDSALTASYEIARNLREALANPYLYFANPMQIVNIIIFHSMIIKHS